VVGKTSFGYIEEGLGIYLKRLKHYTKLDYIEIPASTKTKNPAEAKKREAATISKHLGKNDFVVLLDERGKLRGSEDFARWLKTRIEVPGTSTFVVGGAYGFDDVIYERSNASVSLSSMTFSHQMARLIFLEQLYRGFTILNNEPYHHS
jgi:23S rRNA (pseudouridine1915-N3)-methyltransferase